MTATSLRRHVIRQYSLNRIFASRELAALTLDQCVSELRESYICFGSSSFGCSDGSVCALAVRNRANGFKVIASAFTCYPR